MNDWRRESLLGKDGRTLTGIDCKAKLFTGADGTKELTWHPVVCPLAEPDDEEPDEDVELEVTDLSKEIAGWRTSYRTNFPERTTTANVKKRLTQKLKIFKFFKGTLAPARRSKPIDKNRGAASKLKATVRSKVFQKLRKERR